MRRTWMTCVGAACAIGLGAVVAVSAGGSGGARGIEVSARQLLINQRISPASVRRSNLALGLLRPVRRGHAAGRAGWPTPALADGSVTRAKLDPRLLAGIDAAASAAPRVGGDLVAAGPQGPPGPAGPAGAVGPPGPFASQLVSSAPASTPASAAGGTTFSATATCPSGTRVLGGGYRMSVSVPTQLSRVEVTDSYPGGPESWAATGTVASTLVGASATITAWAVCTV